MTERTGRTVRPGRVGRTKGMGREDRARGEKIWYVYRVV